MNDVRILFEDSDVIVVVKPAGIESQASADGNDMLSLLSAHTGAEVYPVHRLDRGTEGILVYAKTKAAAASLSEAFASGQTDKTYLAVLCGVPSELCGELEDLLYHDRIKNKSYTVKRKRAGVKRASLSYSVENVKNDRALVRVKLHTGRTHQIRVQFASRKLPLLGDTRYGGDVCAEIPKGCFALASVSLSFPHPSTGERESFAFCPFGGIWDEFLSDKQ